VSRTDHHVLQELTCRDAAGCRVVTAIHHHDVRAVPVAPGPALGTNPQENPVKNPLMSTVTVPSDPAGVDVSHRRSSRPTLGALDLHALMPQPRRPLDGSPWGAGRHALGRRRRWDRVDVEVLALTGLLLVALFVALAVAR
jgi:hypothetical protein